MQKLPEETLHELRSRLRGDTERIAKRIKQLSKQDPFNDPDRVSDNASDDTEANELSGHERVSALIDTLKEEQVNIVAAIDRMDAGTYGVCVNCGKLIHIDRLRILPTATLCLDCEQTHG